MKHSESSKPPAPVARRKAGGRTAAPRPDPARHNVLTATARVIARNGLAGARVRDIANDAGMSPAAVLFHYPDNDDLMLDVHARAVDRYFEGRRAATESESDPRRQIVAMVHAGIPPYADPDTIHLLYEMHGLSRQSQAHAALMSTLWEREVDLYKQVLAAGAQQTLFTLRRPIPDVAAVLLALEDGLVLHLVSDRSSVDTATVVALFLGLAADHLGCPGLSETGPGPGPAAPGNPRAEAAFVPTESSTRQAPQRRNRTPTHRTGVSATSEGH